mmetsp:Transcript_28057/g.90729  ORF Transcript_28057/g.90729 Transcript_28057/m.90729 type:complete len:251 (-) Transcript_28057:491-1243(-)
MHGLRLLPLLHCRTLANTRALALCSARSARQRKSPRTQSLRHCVRRLAWVTGLVRSSCTRNRAPMACSPLPTRSTRCWARASPTSPSDGGRRCVSWRERRAERQTRSASRRRYVPVPPRGVGGRRRACFGRCSGGVCLARRTPTAPPLWPTAWRHATWRRWLCLRRWRWHLPALGWRQSSRTNEPRPRHMLAKYAPLQAATNRGRGGPERATFLRRTRIVSLLCLRCARQLELGARRWSSLSRSARAASP